MTTTIRQTVGKTGILPNNVNLIQDITPLKVRKIEQVIKEGVDGDKSVLRMTGIFQKADKKNENGRIYPYSVLREAVDGVQEDVRNRRVVGEYEHPKGAKINLDRISHVITKVWMENKYVYGEAEVIEDMPCGKMLAALLKNDVQIGISSRGVGDMETVMEGQEELQRVCDGYAFVTWDAVHSPSVSDAVMTVMEGRDVQLLTSKRKILVSEIDNWLKSV